MSSKAVRLAIAAALCVAVAGCANVGYYFQAIEGHFRVMAAARSIPDWVGDPSTDPSLRKQLERVAEIREFASRELALPDNGSYRSYAALGRPYVVWNVFAAPEFSVEPKQWCLLVVGCVNYRGYYDQHAAERLADEFRAQGYDTSVGGVPAYSTLGFFNDPVLNTFLRLGEQEVARVVFHELAHQTVYARGDSAFNESFAVAVENEGVRRWLAKTETPERFREFEARQARKVQFIELLTACRERLRDVYASPLAPDAMRRAKADALEQTKREYAALKESWGGYAGYDRWFSQPLNNAAVSSIALYTQWLPAFQRLLESEGGNLPALYRRVEALAQLSKAERSKALDDLMPETPGRGAESAR